MEVRAGHLRRGDRIDGVEVAWVSPLPGGVVMVALDASVSDGSVASLTRRYHDDDLVDVAEPRLTPG